MERTGRQRARHHLMLAVTLLVVAAFLLPTGVGRSALAQAVAPALFLLLVAYAVGAGLWWAAVAARDRRPDPWAYDPELDSPEAVAAFEGRAPEQEQR